MRISICQSVTLLFPAQVARDGGTAFHPRGVLLPPTLVKQASNRYITRVWPVLGARVGCFTHWRSL